MDGIWKLLLEGSGDENEPDEEIKIDEEVEKEIEECSLPIGVMFESFFADTEAEINMALETYEMACIVGGVKVVSEGAEQAVAQDILTEATDNFFDSIVATLKKIKDWFIGGITKLMQKIKAATSKDIASILPKIEADFDKNFEPDKFTYTGHILDVDAHNAIVDGMDKLKDKLGKVANDEKYGVEKSDLTKKAVSIVIESIDGFNSNADTQKALLDDMKKFMGVDGEPKTIKVSEDVKEAMKGCIEAATKDTYKSMKDSIKWMNDYTSKLTKEVKKNANGGFTNKTAKEYGQREITLLNALSSIIVGVINLRLNLRYSAARSYISWMMKVANGKGSTGDAGTATAESYFSDGTDMLSGILEGDCSDDPDEPVEEFTAFANFKALKVWFGDNSKNLTKNISAANKAFAEGDYSTAKQLYTTAKKNGEAALKQLKNIDKSIWTSVIGFVLFNWYYVAWRTLFYIVVKVMEPDPTSVKLSEEDKINLKKEAGKDFAGTQKVIGRVLAESIASCDKMIDACKNPQKVNTEGISFEGFNDEIMESVGDLLDMMESDEPDEGDPDEGDASTKNFNLLETALSFLS